MRNRWWVGLAVLLIGSVACNKTELAGAKPEVEEVGGSKVDLPKVPTFEDPKPNPDGSHSAREMRLKGGAYLDTNVTIKGYVVWAYDCATALRTPEMTEAELKRILTEEPERCDRPNFVIADNPNDPADKGVQVVDVPRALRADEKKTLPPEEIKARETSFKELPAFAVGDPVTVTGQWKQASATGFMNSRGLLVYANMKNDKAPAP